MASVQDMISQAVNNIRSVAQQRLQPVGNAIQNFSNTYNQSVFSPQGQINAVRNVAQQVAPQIQQRASSFVNNVNQMNLNRMGMGQQIQVEPSVQRVPTINVPDFRTPQLKSAPVLGGLSGFAGDIGQSLVNTPFTFVKGQIRGAGGAQQKNPQQLLAGVGQMGSAALNVLPVGTIGKASKAVTLLGRETLKNAVKIGAGTGAVYGGLQGFMSGLEANKDKTLGEQLGQSALSGLGGSVLGAGLGGALGGGGNVLGRWLSQKPSQVIGDIGNLRPKEVPQAKAVIFAQYLRDKLGRFTPKQYQQTPEEIKFIRDFKIKPLTPAETKALDMKYGWLTESQPGLSIKSLTKEEGAAVRALSGKPNQTINEGGKGVGLLDSVNPSGSVFSEYNPKARATMPLAENITTLDKTMGKSPNDLVTIYRGAPKNQKGIVAGDFITTNKQLAKDYAGNGNVLEKQVKLGDILDDIKEPLGEEYIYRPSSTPLNQGFDPLKATVEQQNALLKNPTIGTGQFKVGEIYTQKIMGQDRPVLISKVNPDGSVEGFYAGAISPTEKSFGIGPNSLQPAKWNNPLRELQVPNIPPLNQGVTQLKVKNAAQQIDAELNATVGNPLPWEKGYNPEPVVNTPQPKLTLEDVAKAGIPKKTGIPLTNDAASINTAEARTVLGNEGKGGIGGLHPDVKKQFQDWVNSQRARFVEGNIKSKEFDDLDAEGINGIFKFQSGDKTGRFADVKKYFDTKRQAVIDSGIDVNYKKDYLPQLWNNTDQEVQKVFGTSLSKRPSFTLESIIKDYQEGISKGLTPKFQNISELVGWYETKANKAIADGNFFKYLSKEGLIQPGNKAPFSGWETLNPDRFPKLKVNTGEGTYMGTYKAPKELSTLINNYLNEPKFETLQKIADFASTSKNRMLSFGIPNTAINAHGFNILSRNILGSRNPLEGGVTGIKYMLNPNSAEKYLNTNLEKAPDAIKHGLTLSTSEWTSLFEKEPVVQGGIKGLKAKIGTKWNTAFEKPLFDKMIPALKLQKYEEIVQANLKQGMGDYEAKKASAKFTNDLFGGINWQELGQSKDWQNVKRALILAPDWLKTNVNFAKELPKAFTTQFTNPSYQAYRRFGATFMGVYATMNVVNKISSGHWMFQNDPGHAFEIEAGYTDDGQKRYIRPFNTAVDFVRLPVDIAIGLSKGDLSVFNRIVRNRLSTIAGAAYGLATDTNYAGQAVGVSGKTKYGQDMTAGQRVAGISGQLSGVAGIPAFLQQGLNYATGQTGGEQALLQGFELPFRYSGGFFTGKDAAVADALGVKGKERYDLGKTLKDQANFSDKQLQYIQQTGVQGLQDIIDLRNEKAKIKQLKAKPEVNQLEGILPVKKTSASEVMTPITGDINKINEGYVHSKDAPNNIFEIAGTYLKAGVTDPVTTIKSIIKGQPIRKTTGDAVILERKNGLGQLDYGDKTTQVDHIIPLSLGGTNDQSNLQILTTEQNMAKAKVETYLMNELASGRINKQQAQEKIKNWQAQIDNLPKSDQVQLANDLTGVTTNTPSSIQMQIAKLKLKNSSETSSQVGNIILYKDGTSIKSIDTSKTISKPTLSGDDVIDKKLLSKYSSEITTKQNNILKLSQLGLISQQEAIKQINELETLKKNTSAKVKSLTSKKVKAPKKIKALKVKKVAAPKATKIKIKKIKPLKFKALKAKKV